MAIEILDLPIDSMVIFHSKMLVHQRVLVITMLSTRHVCTIMIYDAHVRMEDDGSIATTILFKNYGQPHSKIQNNIWDSFCI